VADLYEPEPIEIVALLERGLRDRQRAFARRVYRSTLAKVQAERAIQICQAVVDEYRKRLTPEDLNRLVAMEEKRANRRG
jgi:hypothetical protein